MTFLPNVVDQQTFSEDLKSGRPKCAIGSAQMKNL